MSTKGKGKNTRNTSGIETPVTKKAQTPTSSIIRTRHQAVKDANPGKEIKRKPTPGIDQLLKKSKDDTPSPKRKPGKKQTSDNDTDTTPRRGRSSPYINQKTPSSVEQKKEKQKTPNSTQSSKENAKELSSSTGKGRGRPKKIVPEEKETDKEKQTQGQVETPKKTGTAKKLSGKAEDENNLVSQDNKNKTPANKNAIVDPQTDSQSGTDTDTPVRRGRGRPKKIIQEDNQEPGAVEQNEETAEIKPEHPKETLDKHNDHEKEAQKLQNTAVTGPKNQTSDKIDRKETHDETNTDAPTARGRGRLRKKSLEAPVLLSPLPVDGKKNQDVKGLENKILDTVNPKETQDKTDTDTPCSRLRSKSLEAPTVEIQLSVNDKKNNDGEDFKEETCNGVNPNESQEETDINTPAKRGRGRPKKIVNKKQPNKEIEAQKDRTSISGKNNVVETKNEAVTEDVDTLRRSRRKSLENTSESESLPNISGIKNNGELDVKPQSKSEKDPIEPKQSNIATTADKNVTKLARRESTDKQAAKKASETPRTEEIEIGQKSKSLINSETAEENMDYKERRGRARKVSAKSNISDKNKAVKEPTEEGSSPPSKRSRTDAELSDETPPNISEIKNDGESDLKTQILKFKKDADESKPLNQGKSIEKFEDFVTAPTDDKNVTEQSTDKPTETTEKVLETPQTDQIEISNKTRSVINSETAEKKIDLIPELKKPPVSTERRGRAKKSVPKSNISDKNKVVEEPTEEGSPLNKRPRKNAELSDETLPLPKFQPTKGRKSRASKPLSPEIIPSLELFPSAENEDLKCPETLNPHKESADIHDKKAAISKLLETSGETSLSTSDTEEMMDTSETFSPDAVLNLSSEETNSMLDPITGEYSGTLLIPSPKKQIAPPAAVGNESTMLDILASACLSQVQPVTSIQTTTAGFGMKMPTQVHTAIQSSSIPEPTLGYSSETEVGLNSLPTPINVQDKTVLSKEPTQTFSNPVLISPEPAPPLKQTQSLPQSAPQILQTAVDAVSLVNASLKNEHENTWNLSKLINLFIQWQNTDAMCWLDIVLSILAHSPTLKEKAKMWTSQHKDNNSNSAGDACSQKSVTHSQKSETNISKSVLINDVNNCLQGLVNKVSNSVTNEQDFKPELISIPSDVATNISTQSTPVKDTKKLKLKYPVIITLIKAHEQAQYLLQNFLTKPQTKITDSITQEGDLVCQTSSNPQTGAGIKIISPLLTMLHKQPEGGLPLDALTHLGESITKLEDVREVVWDILQPRLKCEKGKNDSPVLALPLLIRESQELKHMFSIEYSLVFNCSKCDFKQENKFVKALPSLPNVPSDFSMKDPAFIRNCFRCNEPGQRMNMKIHRLQDIAMLHFLQGLPKVVYEEMDFEFDGNKFSVTAVVQYKNNPDHFVSWIRNPQGNQWMECDDLKSPLCQFENAPPRIPPEQIHIVMWEKNISQTPAPVLENSRTAGLLSSLLMSTRMVTMSSEGNSKVLTTVPIQYTPVTTVVGKKKNEIISTVDAQGINKIIMYPAIASRPNIISQSKGITSVQTTSSESLESISSVLNPSQELSVQTGPPKSNVVVGQQKNQVIPSVNTASDTKMVSIGGRLVRLTTEQLNAIKNSPGARVSIVGAGGTTTYSIKGLQTKKSEQETKPEKVTETPPTTTAAICANILDPKTSQLSTSQMQTIMQPSNVDQPLVQSLAAAQPVVQPLSGVTPNVGNIIKTFSVDPNGIPVQTSTMVTTETVGAASMLPGTVQTTSTDGVNQPLVVQSALSASSTPAAGFGAMVDPKRPCRVVVDSKGNITAIATKDNAKFIPLTNDKNVNRQILQKFFSGFGENAATTGNSIVQHVSESSLVTPQPAACIRSPVVAGIQTSTVADISSILPTSALQSSASDVLVQSPFGVKSTPSKVTYVKTSTGLKSIYPQSRVNQIPSSMCITAAHHTPQTPPSYTVSKHQDVSSFETAMAVDSISSPHSKEETPVFAPYQVRGRGSRGSRKPSQRGRGRGRGRGYSPNTTLTINESPGASTGRQVYLTPRKVAIPTNNGHILIDVPAGRSVMECLRDVNVVKTLVRKFPDSSPTTNVLDTSSAVDSPVQVSTESSKPGPSTIYSSELLKKLQGPNTNIRSLSIPQSKETNLQKILVGKSAGFGQVSYNTNVIKSTYPKPQTDVLSAALFESGVKDDTSTYSDASNVIVQGVPQMDHYTTHGLDILSQGVAAATQSSDILQQFDDASDSENLSANLLGHTLEAESGETAVDNSQSFDILTQGFLSNTGTENLAPQSAESQAMSILTGGITPQPAPSQALDILTQGLNPPQISQSHALDILTQGISPNVQPTTPTHTEIPQTLTSKISSLQNRSTASMKIGNIGATSSRIQPMIMSPTSKSRLKTSPTKATRMYTIKTNGSRSSELVENTNTRSLLNSTGNQRINVIRPTAGQGVMATGNPTVQSNSYTSLLNPNVGLVTSQVAQSQSVKRKAPTQYVSLLKKAKSSPEIQNASQDTNQVVQNLFFNKSEDTKYVLTGDSGAVYSKDYMVPIENEASSSEYVTSSVTSTGSILGSSDDNIFAKFGMTSFDGIDPREAEVLRQLYEAVSSSGTTESVSLTTNSVVSEVGYTQDGLASTTTAIDPSSFLVDQNKNASVITQHVMSDNNVSSEGNMTLESNVVTYVSGLPADQNVSNLSEQMTLGTDAAGMTQNIVSSSEGMVTDQGVPVYMDTTTGAMMTGEGVVMDTNTGTMVTSEGVVNTGTMVTDQGVVMDANTGMMVTDQGVIMDANTATIVTDQGFVMDTTTGTMVTDQGDPMNDQTAMESEIATDGVPASDNGQIILGMGGLMGAGQIIIGPDGSLTGPGIEGMVTSDGISYVMPENTMSTDSESVVALPTNEQSYQQVIFEEEVVSVGENVEI